VRRWRPFGALFYAFPAIERGKGRLDTTNLHGATELSEGGGVFMACFWSGVPRRSLYLNILELEI